MVYLWGGLESTKNYSLKPSKRVTLTKHDVYSFKGHFHVDIYHVWVLSLIHEGGESKGSLRSNYLINIFILFCIFNCMFSTTEYGKRTMDDVSAVVASKKTKVEATPVKKTHFCSNI